MMMPYADRGAGVIIYAEEVRYARIVSRFSFYATPIFATLTLIFAIILMLLRAPPISLAAAAAPRLICRALLYGAARC